MGMDSSQPSSRAKVAEGDRSRGTPFPLSLVPAWTRSRLDSLLKFGERNERGFFVYMMASMSGTLYIGITNDLCSRIIYFEMFLDPSEAIAREKQLKNWRRDKKEKLIASFNPKWIDLAPELLRKRGPSTPLRPSDGLRYARDDGRKEATSSG